VPVSFGALRTKTTPIIEMDTARRILPFFASNAREWGKMPGGVILTTPEEIETWMTAPTEETMKLQRPLPDGSLKIVARGEKKDE
jgi:hypothetical protein